MDERALYLDLMKRCLTNWIYGDEETIVISPKRNFFKQMIVKFFRSFGLYLVRKRMFQEELRRMGRDWEDGFGYPQAHTMIGLRRLDNIQFCMEDILQNKIPGDFIECGVWRGGAIIFMRAVLKAHGINDRTVWGADSFQGFPSSLKTTDVLDKDFMDSYFSKDSANLITVPVAKVKSNFERYGLLDDQVRFLEGWFKDTLPSAPVQNLALLRLDGDLYESTMDALVHLYPKLSVGGYVIVDDFCLPSCRQAVLSFREEHKIEDPMVEIDRDSVYWKRLQ